MSYRTDIGALAEELATHGVNTLVSAMLVEVEESRVSIVGLGALWVAPADKLLATIRDYLAGHATADKCGQEGNELARCDEFNRAQIGTEKPWRALYYYQLACVDLARIVAEGKANLAAYWIEENLVQFEKLWTKCTKIETRRRQLARLRARLDVLQPLAFSPEAVGYRSRNSLLAS